MIPTRSHSEKGKTLKLVKRSEVAMCWEESVGKKIGEETELQLAIGRQDWNFPFSFF